MVSTSSTSGGIRTLLIANRGEIALRVMRTARRMGIRTVAVHTDLDAAAPHARAADEAVRIGSYLDVDEVVAAAVASGADAVHPGYGFLSERSAFAAALEAAGITLVGPSAAVMEQMGRKDLARDVAVRAGVPVVPHYAIEDVVSTGSTEVTYPVLVKAAAGGGGKGMRVVRSADGLDEAVAAAGREAASAFGDDTLLVERYVERGRHIEVQVLADTQGHVVHLFERDCSTQRRHQKVLEEAPAPTLPDETRALVTRSSVALAQEVGYVGAGTVEFLLDEATGEAYFLEMNTRLQVEHPVTEAVVRVGGASVDLVELQLRVAAGEPLPFGQDDVSVSGHAIEARVYAEDAFGGFLPQAGTVTFLQWPVPAAGDRDPGGVDPVGAPGVRVDAGIEAGQVVSTAYDPMLAKVIAWGVDREAARHGLVDALDRTHVHGLTTNTGFLRELAAGEEFARGAIDTAWLDRNDVPRPDAGTARVLAALLLAAAEEDPADGPWRADGFRLGADPAPTLIELDRLLRVRPGRVDDHEVGAVERAPTVAGTTAVSARVDGVRCEGMVTRTAHAVEVTVHGQRHVFERPDPFADHGPDAGDGSVLAPMPGTVLDVRVVEGQQVTAGQVLGAMEAMKMEFALEAPYDGTVTAVAAVAGAQVPLGARLFEVTADDAEEDA